MWGQIAQAVSGAIQAKSKVNDLKPLEAGDYSHAASTNPSQNTEPQKTVTEEKVEVKQPEIKEEEEKDETSLDSISDGTAKDTTKAGLQLYGKPFQSQLSLPFQFMQHIIDVGAMGDGIIQCKHNFRCVAHADFGCAFPAQIAAGLQLLPDLLQLCLRLGPLQLLQHAAQVAFLLPAQFDLPGQLLFRIFHAGIILIEFGRVLLGGQNGGQGNLDGFHILVIEILT